MWQPCVPRLTLSLRQALLEPAESLAIEDHSRVTLCQQGTETQLGWFCTVETTSAPRPGTTKTERVAVPSPADRGRGRAVRIGEGFTSGVLGFQLALLRFGPYRRAPIAAKYFILPCSREWRSALFTNTHLGLVCHIQEPMLSTGGYGLRSRRCGTRRRILFPPRTLDSRRCRHHHLDRCRLGRR